MRRRTFFESIGAAAAALVWPSRRRRLRVVVVPVDAPTIHEGVEMVRSGGTVLVMPGRYCIDRPIPIGDKPMTLVSSAGPSKTVLAAPPWGERRSWDILGHSGDQHCLVSGFTFDTTGKAEIGIELPPVGLPHTYGTVFA